MDERNPDALALGFRRAKAKSLKIKELGIVPAIIEKDKLSLIEACCKAKAKQDNSDWKTHAKGQTWYVEDLITFSGLTSAQKLDVEYTAAFPATASESEMLADLDSL